MAETAQSAAPPAPVIRPGMNQSQVSIRAEFALAPK
jgi:hypothetical protein